MGVETASTPPASEPTRVVRVRARRTAPPPSSPPAKRARRIEVPLFELAMESSELDSFCTHETLFDTRIPREPVVDTFLTRLVYDADDGPDLTWCFPDRDEPLCIRRVDIQAYEPGDFRRVRMRLYGAAAEAVVDLDVRFTNHK